MIAAVPRLYVVVLAALLLAGCGASAQHTRTTVRTPVETTPTQKAAVAQTKGVTVTQVAAMNGQCPKGSSSCVPPSTAPAQVVVECGGDVTAWGSAACAFSTEVFAALKARYQERSWTPATFSVIARTRGGPRIPSLCKPGPDVGIGTKIGPTWAKHGTWVCRADNFDVAATLGP